ncbi:hypothetical protein [Azospirillum soli]|uniref:hypothetical protein n=1 Tax=Azospirillum soli TaxID=1304799 RepID=UPI001AE49302|nr:hypothetical protein [Azospirillum soli]MBP2315416.1 hypothetical protein [Azospirillum soli]
MNAKSIRAVAAALTLGVAATLAWDAEAGSELVTFPETYAEGVRAKTSTAAFPATSRRSGRTSSTRSIK